MDTRALPPVSDSRDPEATAGPPAAEERISVASNWTLVWWRFRKHRLALVSAAVLLVFYAVVLCPDFFSTQDPELTEARGAFRSEERRVGKECRL